MTKTVKTYLEREYVLMPYEVEVTVCVDNKKPRIAGLIIYVVQ